jgi:hypothetical protein
MPQRAAALLLLALLVLLAVLLLVAARRASPSAPLQETPLCLAGHILHLERRTDRDSNVRSLVDHARAAGIDLRVLAAPDGAACADLRVHPFWDYSIHPGHVRQHLRGGEQGCLAGFLRLFQLDAAFFLEDDAVVHADGFRAMAQQLRARAAEALVLHARRSYPTGWPQDLRALADAEAATDQAGWRSVLQAPNYSNACFAITDEGRRSLRAWLPRVRSHVPADDLLSAACDAHPGVHLEPMAQHWREPAPLRALAPAVALSSRLASASDTERRRPIGDPVACALLP